MTSRSEIIYQLALKQQQQDESDPISKNLVTSNKDEQSGPFAWQTGDIMQQLDTSTASQKNGLHENSFPGEKSGPFAWQSEDIMQQQDPSTANQKDESPAHSTEADLNGTNVYLLVQSEGTEESFILQPMSSTSMQVLEPLGKSNSSINISMENFTGVDEFDSSKIEDMGIPTLLDMSFDLAVGENQEIQTGNSESSLSVQNESDKEDRDSNNNSNVIGDNQEMETENSENNLSGHENDEGGEETSNNEINGRRKRAKRGRADRTSWTAEKNKIKRAKGEEYFGRVKNDCGKSVFNKKRGKKVMKQRCKCKDSPKVVFKCSSVTDDARKELFTKFWSLNRGEKKIFIEQLVEKKVVKQRTVEASSSRRGHSLFYHLKINENGDRVRVCKKMFLNTFSVGEWSVLNWVNTESNKDTPNQERKRKGPSKERELIKQFLDSLPKLESHYCRRDTTKLYLEAMWQSKSELFREYKAYCCHQNKENLQASIFTFWAVFEECNLGLFSPKKDQCDLCCSFTKGNVDVEIYHSHQKRKEDARKEKNKDKEDDIGTQKTAVFTLDMQAVLLSPSLKASALYYKTKLKVHNFTLFNLKTADAYCYLWDETEGGVSADEFCSILYHFLTNEVDRNKYEEVILWSDGCTSQNRNCILSNTLLLVSKKTGLTIVQKYLEKGHTQMECDSIHSTIEKRMRNREIYSPAGYIEICKTARINPKPYQVKYLNHTFFKKYSSLNFTSSIRPGTRKGDPVVTDIKCLKYTPMGSLEMRLSFAEDFFQLPRRMTRPSGDELVHPLYSSKIPLEPLKFRHLQEMKLVLPTDIHPYYDKLPHFLQAPGHKVCNGQTDCPCLIGQ